MAFTTIYFKHPESEKVKKAPIGFSWTVLFFGFFPPLFRGDLKNALILFYLGLLIYLSDYVRADSTPIITEEITTPIIIIAFVIQLFYVFKYNKMFMKRLISQGFLVKQSPDFSIKELEEKLEMKLPTTTK